MYYVLKHYQLCRKSTGTNVKYFSMHLKTIFYVISLFFSTSNKMNNVSTYNVKLSNIKNTLS